MDFRQETCDQLIQLLDEYTNTLLRNLRQFLKIGDEVGGGLIANACIPCLASLAALCHFAAREGPGTTARGLMDKLCDSALSKLATLTRDTHIEEYSYFDLLLEVRVNCSPPHADQSCAEERHVCADVVEKIPRNPRRQNQCTFIWRARATAEVEEDRVPSAFGFPKQYP